MNKLIKDFEYKRIKIQNAIISKFKREIKGFFIIIYNDNFKLLIKLISYFEFKIILYIIINILNINNRVKGIVSTNSLEFKIVIFISNIIIIKLINKGSHILRQEKKFFLYPLKNSLVTIKSLSKLINLLNK